MVHSHQTTSPLAHQCLLYAKLLPGVCSVYTDHSLFNVSSLPSILVNKLMAFTLTNVDHVICVSYTLKENLVLRASLRADTVSVIPNAIDHTKFTPDLRHRNNIYTCGCQHQHHGEMMRCNQGSDHHTPSSSATALLQRIAAFSDSPDDLRIVILSRLVYRKGISMLLDIIPVICARHTRVRFIIGGDGPHAVLLCEMVERLNLHSQVILIGEVAHRDVSCVLNACHIFLNTSLTEAFCIAILEAVACGLLAVSTRIGGVPEILPLSLIEYVLSVMFCVISRLFQYLSICAYLYIYVYICG